MIRRALLLVALAFMTACGSAEPEPPCDRDAGDICPPCTDPICAEPGK